MRATLTKKHNDAAHSIHYLKSNNDELSDMPTLLFRNIIYF